MHCLASTRGRRTLQLSTSIRYAPVVECFRAPLGGPVIAAVQEKMRVSGLISADGPSLYNVVELTGMSGVTREARTGLRLRMMTACHMNSKEWVITCQRIAWSRVGGRGPVEKFIEDARSTFSVEEVVPTISACAFDRRAAVNRGSGTRMDCGDGLNSVL